MNVTPKPWWQHTLTLGIGRQSVDAVQTQPRRTFAEDTLLAVTQDSRSKRWIGYNTTVQGSLGRHVSALLTAGFDHYRVPATVYFDAGGLLTTEGTLQPGPGSVLVVTRESHHQHRLFRANPDRAQECPVSYRRSPR